MPDQATQKRFRRWVESGDPIPGAGVGAPELAGDIDEALRRHPHNESRALSYLSNRGWRIGPGALKRGPVDFAPNDDRSVLLPEEGRTVGVRSEAPAIEVFLTDSTPIYLDQRA